MSVCIRDNSEGLVRLLQLNKKGAYACECCHNPGRLIGDVSCCGGGLWLVRLVGDCCCVSKEQ